MALEAELRLLKGRAEEIAALSDVYEDVVKSKPKTVEGLESTKLEAKFARDELLRMSLEIKSLVSRLEERESMR